MNSSPFTDLERPPLSERALERMLVRPEGLWRRIQVVTETGSTNADLAEAVRAGADEGRVLVAESQTAGRGRLGRSWTAPPRSGLMFSVLLRPAVGAQALGWLPLLTGLSVATAVRRITGRATRGDFGQATGTRAVDVRLKWPNDLLVGDRKLAGILAERVADAVVVGVGLNVSLRADELPVPTATSLACENAAFQDREALLRAVLRELETWYREWTALGGDPETSGLRTAYKELCATLDRRVRVMLPGDRELTGVAVDVDPAGGLVVRGDDGAGHVVHAGDVVHVR
ncbi:biotin--[acetyl-CoA-carboxylase] ligase [Thermomonospora cellulosilytica]|uniref:biotin--[biotin carboxyl-carrier protein] ligase n=1 Tax=Thermomonospora cellulosilytica TaxID=1411118 RepID=A0A7W3RCK4_9ACTN|nr:biotin--[acetyl-CoA-carboxylase] ligase [Thermomonospora cellulosilytica]MBA9008011.1 BirA family biotin operon repressor/biotin-[acetyl-CoA-carboxylase] ligase [Thermomonospora cellulosilytica]